MKALVRKSYEEMVWSRTILGLSSWVLSKKYTICSRVKGVSRRINVRRHRTAYIPYLQCVLGEFPISKIIRVWKKCEDWAKFITKDYIAYRLFNSSVEGICALDSLLAHSKSERTLFWVNIPQVLQVLDRFLDIWYIKAVDNGVRLNKVTETYKMLWVPNVKSHRTGTLTYSSQ